MKKVTSFGMVVMMVFSLGSFLNPKEVEAALSFGNIVNYGSGSFPYGVVSGDFNADGILDLVVTNVDVIPNKFSVLIGVGNGTFNTVTSYDLTDTFGITSGDFNADGKLDLAITNDNTTTSNVSVLIGVGNGTFGTAVKYTAGNKPRGITSGDFNADGKLDLAVANYMGSNVSILIGTGTGTFGAATNYTVGSWVSSILSGDFNADGKLDLAVTNNYDSNISVLIGVGNGTFGTRTNYTVGTSPEGITSGDFNADGILDLSVVNRGSNNISILIGTGTGTFGAATNYTVGTSPFYVTSGDFNADGKSDLAVSNNGGNISVLIGVGNGTFDTAVNYTAVSGLRDIISGDFNSDGKLDLATASYLGSNVSILLNTTPFYPVASATGTAQTLGAGVQSTFEVAMDEPGTIYLQKTGTGTLTTQAVASNLTGLTLTGGTISGYTFSGSTKTYYGVSTDSSYVTVTPTGSGSITVNGVPNKTGVASATIAVNSSVTKKIEVKVSEVGKVDNIYTIKILQSPATSYSGTSTMTESGGYRTYKFTTSGNFTAGGTITGVEMLTVGGGGGGGGYNGNGGSAGQMVSSTNKTISSGATTVTIGTGGAGGPYNTNGSAGAGSSFGAVTSATGGAGGSSNSGNYSSPPQNMGGAGAGGAGQAYASPPGYGVGGVGVANSITGSSVTYATGGDSKESGSTAGAANTGNGGCGKCTSGAAAGLDGGTGVVIIKFAVPTQTPTLATPTFTQTYGTNTASVTISGPVGSTIYYTTDGTDPTTSSSVYSTPIAVGAQIVKAMAVKSGSDNSAIGVVSYVYDWTTDITNKNAFIGRSSAVATTPYTITVPAANLINDGLYNIVGVNEAGRTSTTLAGWLTVDNTPPEFIVTAPATGALINSATVSYELTSEAAYPGSGSKITFTRTGGAADGTVHTCELASSVLTIGTHNGTILNATNCNNGAISLVSGAIYSVAFDFVDSVGNAATTVTNTGVTVDTTPPTATFGYSANPTPTGTNTITATFSEALLSVPTISVNQPGSSDISNATMTLSTGNIYTYDYLVSGQSLPQYQDGTATVTITATDLAGNALSVQNEATRYFTIDTVPPTIDSTIYVSQRLKNPNVTTSNVRLSKTGNIYLVLNGQTPANQAAIDSLVTAKNAYKVVNGATANALYTITTPLSANLNDGVYNFVAVSTVGNVSAPFSGVGSWQLTVDNTAPNITVSSNATSAGILKIGDEIIFTITPGTPELNATVNSVSYNGQALTWSTPNSGVTYTATYTVASGQTDRLTALQLTEVTLTDSVGNTSTSASSTDVAKTIDANAPTNQNSVFPGSTGVKGGAAVTIVSSGTSSNNVWFAPLGTTSFAEGTAMTKATDGISTSILSPATDGTYRLYVLDAAGNYSVASTSILTVDAIAPTASTPTSTAQILKSGDSSSSTIQTNEQGNIYLIKNGTTVTTQAQIDSAITASNAFLGRSSAQAGIPYTITVATGLHDGLYNVVAVDGVGNVSSPFPGWLTVDNTKPVITAFTAPAFSKALVPVTFTATDTGGSGVAGYLINESATTPLLSDVGWSATSLSSYQAPAVDGPITLYAWAKDAVGNISLSSTDSVTVDGTIPTVTSITSTTSSSTNISPIPIVITFSEEVVGFTKSDITVTGGTIPGTVSSADNIVFTFDLVPTTDGTVTVNIAADVATDLATNNNSASTEFSRIYDTSAPTSVITAICSTTGNSCTAEGALLSPQGSYNVSKIEGTTSDVLGGSGVSSVMISIQDTTNTGNYYSSGTGSFSSVSEVYIQTDFINGTSWSFDSSTITTFEVGQTYLIHIKAIDTATNEESPVQSMQFQVTNVPPVVSAVSASENSSGVVTVTYNVDDTESTQVTTSLFYKIGATLNGAITSGANSLVVSDGTNFPNTGIIMIGDEMISYTGKSTNTLTGLIRGSGVYSKNTTAISHDTGLQIYMYAANAVGNVGLINKGLSKTISWQANLDADGYQSTTGVVKVVANDGAVGSMIGSSSSATFILDAAKPTVTTDTLLINDSAVDYVGISPNVTLKLQNVTGAPANENVSIQFSVDGVWYKANSDHTLTLLSEGGSTSAFSSNPTILNALYWNWTMTDKTDVIQVKITDSYGNVSEIDTNNVSYNAPPEFDADFGTNGLTVSQILDAGANFAKLKIDYRIRDTDNTVVTPTFSYKTSVGGNSEVISNANIEGLVTDVSGAYTTYTVYWIPTSGIETAAASFTVSINDLEGQSTSIAERTVTGLIIDKKSPDITTPVNIVTFDAGVAGVTDSGLVTITLPDDISNVEYRIVEADLTPTATQYDTGWQSLPSSTTIPWTFDIGEEVKVLKYKFRDIYGNTTPETTITTLAPIPGTSFLVQDATNTNIGAYDMYIGWGSVPDGTVGFASYKLEYATSTDNSVFGSYASVGSNMESTLTNYYLHRGLNPTWYYKYRLGVTGTNGNTSVRAGSPVTARPDAIQNFGEGGGGGGVATAAKVENVVPSQHVTTKDVTIGYMLTDGSISKKINPTYEARVFYNIGITLPASAYAGGNLTVSDASKLKSSGYIQINNEVIAYSGKTGNILTGLTRGTWPTSPRATRQNSIFFQGTPVWIMASNVAPTSLTNTSISTGQIGSIIWSVYDESALAGSSYSNVGIRVLVHDNQDAGSGPLSTQSDYSEIGTLDTFNLTAPTVKFDIAEGTSTEDPLGTPSVNVGLTLSRAYPIAVSYAYTTTGSTATLTTDYTITASPITFEANSTTKNITLDIVNDTTTESSETIVLNLDSTKVTAGGIQTYTNTITDNDGVPTVGFETIAPDGVNEGNTGSTTVTVPVILSSESGSTITVPYTVSGTATQGEGGDYVLASSSLIFAPGSTRETFTFTVTGDQNFEQNENVVITFGIPDGATVTTDFGIYTYTILNDDTVPVISFNTPKFSNNSESTATVTIPISLSASSYQDAVVNYSATSGTTASLSDYSLGTGTTTISAGATTGNIVLSINQNSIQDGDRIVEITLTSGNANATASSTNNVYTYTINDDDNASASFASTQSSLGYEDNAGVAIDVPITVTLSSSSSASTTINYTVGGTATNGTDYSTLSGSLIITAGNSTGDIVIHLTPDSIDEVDETIEITLTSATGAQISGTNYVYTYTITDNDENPTVGFTTTTGEGSEDTAGTISIPVTLTDGLGAEIASGKTVIVNYSVKSTGTTATSYVDYVLAQGALTFAPGETSKSISLVINDDFTKEADETIIIELSLPLDPKATLGTSIFTYTILDNEPDKIIGFSTVESSGLEGDSSNTVISIPLSLTGSSTEQMSIDYSIKVGNTGTATKDVDYTITEGTIIIAANTTLQENIEITIIGDTTIESNETVKITLSNPINVALNPNPNNQVYTYTILNDDADTVAPTVTLLHPELNPMEVIRDATYTEYGASVTDNVDTGLTAVVTGSVNTALVGTYTITYTATDAAKNVGTATRTVNVVLATSYDITATAGANGTIIADAPAIMTPDGVTSVTTHATQIYTITPATGYAVDTLVVDGINRNPNTDIVLGKYTFTDVITNHSIRVTFTNAPDVTLPVIVLNGDNPMTVIVGSSFTDPGVSSATDDRDGNLLSSVVSTGTVNANAVGTYTITYTVSDVAKNKATETRTVNVVYANQYTITVEVASGSHGSISPTTGLFDSQTNHTFSITPEDATYRVSSLTVDNQAVQEAETYTFTNLIANHSIAATFSLVDAVKPTITLNMPELNPMTINSGTTFVDPGATAVDSSQRVVDVVASGNVNTSTAGSYTITYTATDIDGVVAIATRTVIVQDITAPTITDIAIPVITQTAAAITWTTNEPATSQVIWGTETGVLTNTTTKDNTLSIYHVVTLSNLTENTPYYFKVISEDSSTNSKTSDPESTFTSIPTVATTTVVVLNTHTTNNPANDNTSKFVPDTIAPKITDYKIYDISAFEAKVSFSTDEETLSFAEYGKTNSYGENSANNLWSKDHIINLRGLKFGTDYHVKVTAVDKAGNASSTEDKVFKTKFFSENPDDLTKIDNVEQFQNEIESTIESILPALIPPFIEEPKVIDITENSATITYRTNIKAYPVVGYIEESAYDATKANPYLIETSDTTAKSFEHTLKLLNLRPNMLYHLQARAFSLPQVVGKSGEITFTTKASKIKGSIIQKRKDSFVVVWTTDEPTSSIVEYKNIKTGEVSRIIDSVNKISTHSVKAENLIPGTTYEVKISGINARGNVVEGAEVLKVTTLVDVTPPIIASFKVESSLVSGRTDRAQSIVSWQTDEPSTSIVYYEEGSGSPDKPLANKQQDTTTLVTNHVVILSTLKPGTIYRFQIASKDDAGNTAKLPIRTIITPRQNESIVDVIFKNFDQTFNFLKNVK